MIVNVLEMKILAEDYSEETRERSPGLHLSPILRELDEAAHGNKYRDMDEQTRQNYFTMGFLWERLLSELLVDTAVKKALGTLVRPGELVLDGIAMSPDALDLTDYALEEYKATWMSSNHPIDSPKFWYWIKQMQCYCKALATNRARLRAFFVGGDWRSSGPQVKCWQFDFTDREIEETWSMVRNHARYRGWV